MIKLNVSAANITVEEKETLTEGRVGLLCQFRFTDEWNGLAKTAVFDGADSRDVILKSDTVAIPAECLASEGYSLSVGVYGKNAAGDIVIPTVYATVGKIQRSAYPSGREPAAPTPDVVAQIQQAAANAEELARSVREDADLGKFNGGKGEKGEKGDRGETGPAGEAGGFYTPAVTQPNANTMRVAFTPSKEDMPDVEPKDIILPAGGGSGGSGGYYAPSVDADGNLTWTPSKADMPAVDGANIKGPKGISGVYVGSGDMPDGYNVQIDPDGRPSDIVPYIGTNGNWWIGEADTGIAAQGKSAYQYAQDGGYTGTEAAFTEKLALEIDAPYIFGKIEAKVPFMKYGRKLESNTDLNSLVPASADDGISGTYYSPNRATTASLLNCPITGSGFTMDVSYSTGNDYKYIRQDIKSYSEGDWVRSYSNGTWTVWRKTVKTGSEEWNSLVRVETVKRHPSLTATKKAAIKALIKDYVDNRSVFYYYGDHTRNAFATGSIYASESGKWGLNCETFVQNILMGRSVSDYVGKTADTYTNTITKTAVSDFGHYFEFENRKTAYGLIKNPDATNPAEYYYGYVKPLADSYKYSYSRNSYWSQYAEDAGNVGGQNLNSFMLAGDMAFELYQKGCEISLSELEVGDILFNKHQGDDATESTTFFHKMAWRNIAHVFLVYDISSDGKITLAECTSGYSAPIVLRAQDSSYEDDRTRFAYLMRNTVFCARLPAAWTGAGNVPDAITAI